MKNRFLLLATLFAAISVFLAACGDAAQPEAEVPATQAPTVASLPAPTASTTATAMPAATVPPTAGLTAVPTGTPVLVPTATPAELATGTSMPLPTPTPVPTATPLPKPAATPTPLPTPTRTPEAKATDTPEPSADRQSDIIDLTLEDLTISVGTTVTWTNRDGPQHTATSGVPPNKDGIWDSPFLSKGRKFSFTFDQPGVFPYWCRVHPFMVATVTVEG